MPCLAPASAHILLSLPDNRTVFACETHIRVIERIETQYGRGSLDRHAPDPACSIPSAIWVPGDPSKCDWDADAAWSDVDVDVDLGVPA